MMVSVKESSRPLVSDIVVISTIVLTATPAMVVRVWRLRPRMCLMAISNSVLNIAE
jgi:hypothetical protein